MTSAGAYFTLYVGLWTSQTLLVTMAVQPNGSYLFDFATVCLLVELLKFVGAVGAVSLGGDGGNASGRLARVRRLIGSAPNALPFAIPSILYTAFNLLQFVNLALVPAPTFRTVINIKILFTALFSSCAFGVRLRAAQWGALALLVFGCAVAQLDDSFEFISAGPFALICLQGSLSSVAAVYSHLLLDSTPGSGKGSAGAQGFWARSAWLYAWGALTNLLFLLFFKPQVLSSSSAFFAGYTPLTLCILANCALAGLSTALLLRVLSAVAKEFANAAEIITTALAARALLETPLKPTIGAGAALVIIAMALYSRADSDHAQPRPRARDSETPDNESEASADERRGLLTA